MARTKLIEVALPLDAINRESAREKSIRHGHPSTLHLWWSRKPLATCRAVLFASLVDDPAEPHAPPAYLAALDELPKPASPPLHWERMTLAEQRRERLFAFMGQLVRWENSTNGYLLATARRLITLACEGDPPPVLDPFCGGGSIPLEAQRLGLQAHASDLNPVAVLITKALIEIPPRFAGMPPVNPEWRNEIGGTSNEGRQPREARAPRDGPSHRLVPRSSPLVSASWQGAAGLAADVRYYGRWMRDEAERRIGHLYPKATPPSPAGGRGVGGAGLTVIAWLWARTVRCPNPACGAHMPLTSKWWLSTKPGRKAWVEPIVDRSVSPPAVRFTVKTGTGRPPDPPKLGRGARFRCLACGGVVQDEHIKAEGMAGRMGAQLMAIVAEGERGRIYLPPDEEHEAIATSARPQWEPEQELPYDPRAIWCTLYGLRTFRDLFTPRQLVALTTFSDLVAEARERVLADARAAGLPNDGVPLAKGGAGAQAYADAVAVYLALAVGRVADRHSNITTWDASPSKLQVRGVFARQAIPMAWDFAEGNIFGESSGAIGSSIEFVARCIDSLPRLRIGSVRQLDAATSVNGIDKVIISTDPPYYDNIGYADLSDFFYVWLRRSLAPVFPDLFRTLLTPKTQELVATPYRFGGSKQRAQRFFEEGLGRAFRHMRAAAHPDYPVTVFYAFKQAEAEADENDNGADAGEVAANGTGGGVASTGWETMLSGLIGAGFQITATWPMRSELGNRILAKGTNALASSIVLACRPRPSDAPVATRAEFLRELADAMRRALPVLASGQVAPVDLAQAAIGPGMAVYSRYRQVLRQDGRPVTVREALADINRAIAAYRTERMTAFDGESRFCLDWYTQYGWADGPYGDADVLARAYNVAPNAMERDGLLTAARGRVRLLAPGSYPPGVAPLAERPFQGSAWEACLRLAVTLQQAGEAEAAALALALGEGVANRARELAVWLYTVANDRRRAEDAYLFNALDASWAAIQEQMARQSEGRQARF